MILETAKELRRAVRIAADTVLTCCGFPPLALLPVLLIFPWPPFYRVAAYLGGVVLEIKSQRTVKLSMRKLSEEPMHVS
jgi:hypothetical protein